MFNEKYQYKEFEVVFKEHYSSLANYAFSILRSEHDAEDVVQDVFIKIWQNTPHIINNENVKFYLITAVKNGCISFLRKGAGKKFIQLDSMEHQADVLEKRETITGDPMDITKKALALLPPQCGVIFKLSRFGNLTYQQIADELGISVKTVENQVGKALKLMRDYAKKNNITFLLLLILSIKYFINE